MHKLHIENFGPVKNCEFTVDDFCVLTGAQASGKSTIAKVIFYFRTIKNEIAFSLYKYKSQLFHVSSFTEYFQRELRRKFIEIFDGISEMNPDMCLQYYYDENTLAKIVLEKTCPGTEEFQEKSGIPVFSIEFSNDIKEYLKKIDNRDNWKKKTLDEVKKELQELFHDEYNIIYVPAGREMITLLAGQLDYLFMVMDDAQKANIDYCSRNYIEEMKKIKPQYENGLYGLYQKKRLTSEITVSTKTLEKMMDLIEEILKAKYVFKSGEDRLLIGDDKYLKMNYTSSGQQESVWILNLIFYYALEGKKTFLILEEPEAHLYPETQKKMAELIALFVNMGNGTLVTTHSPYILGAFNNLLYASFLGTDMVEKVDEIIAKEYWIAREKTRAFYVENGEVRDIMDKELPLIENEVIDGISETINSENDKLLEIHMEQQKDI